MHDLDAFEKGLQKHLTNFTQPKPPRPRARPIARPGSGVTVSLAVRNPGQITDTLFTHVAKTVSKLEARIEAERAARAAGWTKIAYVVDIK